MGRNLQQEANYVKLGVNSRNTEKIGYKTHNKDKVKPTQHRKLKR